MLQTIHCDELVGVFLGGNTDTVCTFGDGDYHVLGKWYLIVHVPLLLYGTKNVINIIGHNSRSSVFTNKPANFPALSL